MPVGIKTVSGKRYVYFEHYVQGKKIQKYCGPEGSERARTKALKYELEVLEKRADADRRRIEEIKRELERIQGQR